MVDVLTVVAGLVLGLGIATGLLSWKIGQVAKKVERHAERNREKFDDLRTRTGGLEVDRDAKERASSALVLRLEDALKRAQVEAGNANDGVKRLDERWADTEDAFDEAFAKKEESIRKTILAVRTDQNAFFADVRQKVRDAEEAARNARAPKERIDEISRAVDATRDWVQNEMAHLENRFELGRRFAVSEMAARSMARELLDAAMQKRIDDAAVEEINRRLQEGAQPYGEDSASDDGT